MNPGAQASSTWRGAALVVAVFASGVLFGVTLAVHLEHGAGHGSLRHEGHGPERVLLAAIDRHVHLDDAQREQVAAVLRSAHHDRIRILAPVQPALDDLRRRNEARIRELLRDDQRPNFDAFTARMAERRRRGMPPPGPEWSP